MPYTKICIHYVWSTKNRVPTLTKPFRYLLFDHILKNAIKKQIHIDSLNGHVDYVHCLVWLKPGQTISEIARLIKGESAHWFNHRSGFQSEKLEWQDEYFAVSVSESIVPAVRRYIDNQERHHQKKNFMEEYKEFIERYHFE